MTFLTSSGLSPSKTNYTQVAQSIQSGSLNYAVDSSGTANTVSVTLSPVPAAYKDGMTIYVKIANTNSGATNVNANGLGNIAVHFKGSALVGMELQVGQIAVFTYLGGVFQLISSFASGATVFNGGTTGGSANTQTCSTTPSSYTLVSGNIITFTAGFTNTAATTLNAESTGAITIKKNGSSGLVDLAAGDITATDSYQVQYNGTFYVLLSSSLSPSLFFQVANNGNESVPATFRQNIGAIGKMNIVVMDTSGTYTPSAHLIGAIVHCTGGGASGSTNSNLNTGNGGGGGAGAEGWGYYNAATIGGSVTVTIGAGGTGVTNGSTANNGSTTSFGSIMSVSGGTASDTVGLSNVNSGLSSGGKGGNTISGAQVSRIGWSGDPGFGAAYNFELQVGGKGADSSWGAGGRGSLGISNNTNTNAENAIGVGAGGGGASNGGNSGSGQGGRVVIYELLAS